jgi:SAM-dependent methyltransferase
VSLINWWDLLYKIFPWVSLGRLQSPWDTDQPPIELIKLVESRRVHPCRVLDVGCGTGSYLIYLASKGFDGVGIDISSVAIQKARTKATKRNVNCRFYSVNFLDLAAISTLLREPFDLVIDHGCLHSIKRKDRRLYTPSLSYVTHTKSLFVLWAFRQDSQKIQFLGGLGSIDPMEVGQLLSKNFKIFEQRNVTRDKTLFVLERRQIKKNKN